MLTNKKRLNNMGGRANNSTCSGISAPDRLGDFFISDFFGSAENTKQLLAGIISDDCLRPVSSRNLNENPILDSYVLEGANIMNKPSSLLSGVSTSNTPQKKVLDNPKNIKYSDLTKINIGGYGAPVSKANFLCPFWGMRTENIKNIGQSIPMFALVESPACSNTGGNTKNIGVKMTNSISIYNFNQNQVRTATIDNQPYFNLNDCCAALGIARGYKSAVRLSADGVRETSLTDKLGRQQIAKFINEPNLYRLIFRSNKPQAQAFADWVYNEVLPSIRKTGSYGAPQTVQVDMKAIGGMVKKCCAVAVRDELNNLIANDFESDNWQKIIALMLTNRVNHLMEAKKQELITLIKQ